MKTLAVLLILPMAVMAECVLQWDHPTPNEVDGYTLYWEDRDGVVDNVPATPGMTCPFPAGSKGTAWVTAYNEWGESEGSNVVPFGAPDAPVGFGFVFQ